MKKKQNPIHLWSLHLPDHMDEIETCRALLTDAELERAEKYIKPNTTERFILYRGLLRRILGKFIDTDPTAITFKHNEHGKPFLADAKQTGRTEFNISHSRDRLLIAITTDRSIGVDIEHRRTGINTNAIAKRWFSQEERENLQTLENPEKGFFDTWAKKEAYIKALGTGIFKDLNTFTVPHETHPNTPALEKTGAWFFQTLEIDPTYAAALVSEAPITPIQHQTL